MAFFMPKVLLKPNKTVTREQECLELTLEAVETMISWRLFSRHVDRHIAFELEKTFIL